MRTEHSSIVEEFAKYFADRVAEQVVARINLAGTPANRLENLFTSDEVARETFNELTPKRQDRRAMRINCENDWLELKPGQHRMRIAPPFSKDGLSYVTIINFNGCSDSEGKVCSPLSLDYIFKNSRIARYLEQQGCLTMRDYEQWRKHGCPMRVLAKSLKAVLPEAEYKEIVSKYQIEERTQYLWNVLYISGPDGGTSAGELFKWSTSKNFFESYVQQMEFVPTLADPEKGNDFVITATGEESSRRYGAPIFIPQPTPLKYDGDLFDLLQTLASGVKTFDEVVKMITEQKAELLKLAKIDPVIWSN